MRSRVLTAAPAGVKRERASQRRAVMFGAPRHMSQREASDFLLRQVFEDARMAGWLKPCARKPGGGVFYARADVEAVSARLVAGEYPEPREGIKA